MVHGYLVKEYKMSADMRKMAFLTILPHADKHRFSFQKFSQDFWPLKLDEQFMEQPEVAVSPLAKIDNEEERRKEYLKIMHQHNPNRYKVAEENTK